MFYPPFFFILLFPFARSDGLFDHLQTALKLSHSESLDPEVSMTPKQLIESKGYPYEEHNFQTPDGYIITLHRIPHGSSQEANGGSREVAFLQHGLLCDSTNWITNLGNESAGFVFADSGYDVWLGNVRGNSYGLNHTHLDVDDDSFWDWTWDEISEFDLSSALSYVLNVTERPNLYYIGHSQGTMTAFALFSRNQQLAKKVKAFFALAPVARISHITSPVRYLAEIPEFLMYFIAGRRNFLPSNKLIHWLGRECYHRLLDDVCENVLFVLCGFDSVSLNVSRLPVYIGHTPSGTSVRNMVHYAQQVLSGKFQSFDYGYFGNMLHYHEKDAPEYSVKKMTYPPVYVFSGGKDFLADAQDVKWLLSGIPDLRGVTTIPYYNHLDFIWAIDATTKIYKPILQYMQSIP